MRDYRDTKYRDELNTPIYEHDVVMVADNIENLLYLGVVEFNAEFGGWCIRLTAIESEHSGTGWVSLGGFAFTQWRTLKQFKRRCSRRLRKVRLSMRSSNALCGLSHLQYAR